MLLTESSYFLFGYRSEQEMIIMVTIIIINPQWISKSSTVIYFDKMTSN